MVREEVKCPKIRIDVRIFLVMKKLCSTSTLKKSVGDEKVKVLIIDDEPDICLVLRDFVEREGIQCSLAHDGMQGLDLINEEHFDLILLDLKMPNMSGFDLLRMLAYGGQLCDKKVVVLTAFSLTNKEKEQMKLAGVTEILAKPFSPESIEKIMQKILSLPNVV